MGRWRQLLAVLVCVGFVASPLSAEATHNADLHRAMDVIFTSPNASTNSDLAFWGDHAFIGYYRNDAPSGGVRIFDISDPEAPRLVKDVQCDGGQNDPIVWDRNGNGIADLLLLAVDRTMAGPECGAPRTAHDDRSGWEGIRIFTMSDDPDMPFAEVEQVAAVYQDCGSHAITLWPGLADEGRLIVYNSSYPLRPGPTCGQSNGPLAGRDPLHGVIQVVEVPVADPAASREIAEPPIVYPGDPDNSVRWCERGLCGLEPAARGCHDIVVHMGRSLAGGGCAEQGQVWNIGPDGIPDTINPVVIADDEVTSGGTGDIPGAADFFQSLRFNNAGTVINLTDESLGSGCPTMTTYQPTLWNPAGGTHMTGRMFFLDADTGEFLSEFHVGDVRPEEGAYCSAHMGMALRDVQRDMLVNAWYQGGVDVIDFSNPRKPREVAYHDVGPVGSDGGDNWSAYPYLGPEPRTPAKSRGVPIHASDGVRYPSLARGFVVFRAQIPRPTRSRTHLNPQTMD